MFVRRKIILMGLGGALVPLFALRAQDRDRLQPAPDRGGQPMDRDHEDRGRSEQFHEERHSDDRRPHMPPPRHEERPPPPRGEGYRWRDGRWTWDGRRWVWTEGRWYR